MENQSWNDWKFQIHWNKLEYATQEILVKEIIYILFLLRNLI